MLEIPTGKIVRALMLTGALCAAGSASAQETLMGSALPGECLQAEADAAALVAEMASAGDEARDDQGRATAAPVSGRTWDLDSPRLDPFGNETVPVFDSSYSGRLAVRR